VVRIAITKEAYDAIVATLPLGAVALEPKTAARGIYWVWIEPEVVKKLARQRGPRETYSHVIMRLAAGEGA
jgi:hypothetical protein